LTSVQVLSYGASRAWLLDHLAELGNRSSVVSCFNLDLRAALADSIYGLIHLGVEVTGIYTFSGLFPLEL
jgi:hypothetical protein